MMNNGHIENFLSVFKSEIEETVKFIFEDKTDDSNQKCIAYLEHKDFLVDDNTNKIYDLFKNFYQNKVSFETLCGNDNNKKILEKTNFYIELIENDRTKFFEVFDRTNIYFDKELNINLENCIFSKILLVKFLKFLYDKKNDYVKIFTLSVLIYIYKDPKYFNDIYRIAIESPELNADQMLFLLFQCYRYYTMREFKGNDETKVLERLLYKKAYNTFKSQIDIDYKPIPPDKRNKNVIVIFAGPIMGIEYSPTRVSLGKCHTLIKYLGKKALLISTNDDYKKGLMPFNCLQIPKSDENLVNYNSIVYKDISIPFYQSDCNMPDINEIRTILASLNNLKPYLIINLASFNITADLCDMFAPVLTISVPYYFLPVTESRFQVVGRKVTESEYQFLDKFGFGKENIIESLFTFDFTPQKNKYARGMFNLPEEKFLIVIIGIRLDFEITEEFINVLHTAIDYGIGIVFVGCFEGFAGLAQKNENFANNAKYLGYQKDVLAIMELCDLYVNPKRLGGGTSAGEAMFKGLPVVSFAEGDVALTAGEDFWVNSYKEMEEKIIRYATDKEFYQEMSAKAKKRGEAVLDTKKELAAMIKTAEARSIF